MINPWLVIGVALGIIVGSLVLVVAVLLMAVVEDFRTRRGDRRRSERRRERIDIEGSDAIEAWGETIPMVWPARAPRNGTPFEEGGQQETSA